MNVRHQVLPPGRYPVIVTGCEMRPHKTGKGRCYYQLHMVVTDGLYVGHRLFDWLHLHRRAKKRARIEAERKFNAICAATDSWHEQTIAVLRERPLTAVVHTVPAWDGFGLTNQVADYERL